MRRTEEQRRRLVDYIRSRYTYDTAQGTVRNRKNQVIKGFDNNDGYLILNARVDGSRHLIYLHHLVWALVYGSWPKQIDHVNGDPRDNRIENLREVSRSENDMNRVWAWRPNAKTGLPGVYKSRDCYRIHVGGKYYSFRDKYSSRSLV